MRFGIIPVLLAVGVILFFGFWGLYEAIGPPPCETFSGNITGEQVYEGQRIQCFHGHVVEAP